MRELWEKYALYIIYGKQKLIAQVLRETEDEGNQKRSLINNNAVFPTRGHTWPLHPGKFTIAYIHLKTKITFHFLILSKKTLFPLWWQHERGSKSEWEWKESVQ